MRGVTKGHVIIAAAILVTGALIALSTMVRVSFSRVTIENPDAAPGPALLAQAAHEGDLEKVKLMVAANPQWLHESAFSGASPMTSAITRRNPELVRIYLEAGADPDFGGTQMFADSPPILQAVLADEWEIAALLLKAGADSTLKDEQIGSALDAVRRKGYATVEEAIRANLEELSESGSQ